MSFQSQVLVVCNTSVVGESFDRETIFTIRRNDKILKLFTEDDDSLFRQEGVAGASEVVRVGVRGVDEVGLGVKGSWCVRCAIKVVSRIVEEVDNICEAVWVELRKVEMYYEFNSFKQCSTRVRRAMLGAHAMETDINNIKVLVFVIVPPVTPLRPTTIIDPGKNKTIGEETQ